MRHVGVGTFKSTAKMKEMVNAVLDSGQISYGPMSLRFELEFAKHHRCEYAILSNSGTSALHVALQALKEVHKWPDGSRVIVPATTFVATANIVLHNNMVPVFVDVDPLTYNIDPEQIEKKINLDTRAIIPVNLFGQSADLNAITEISYNFGLKTIEDSCETMFVSHKGLSVGSWGDIGCFSTYVAHLLVTGVGGISTTNDPVYAGKMRSLVNHGLTLDALNPGKNFSPQATKGRRFTFNSTGHSFRITELEAALGLAQMDDMAMNIAIRQRNAKHLTQGLKNINEHYKDTFQLPTIAEGNEHAFMMFPIVLKQGNKEDLIAHLNSYDIETRDMLPLLNQPAFWYLPKQDYPVSMNLIKNGLYVGVHQDLSVEDIQYMIDVFGLWIDKDFPAIYLDS